MHGNRLGGLSSLTAAPFGRAAWQQESWHQAHSALTHPSPPRSPPASRWSTQTPRWVRSAGVGQVGSAVMLRSHQMAAHMRAHAHTQKTRMHTHMHTLTHADTPMCERHARAQHRRTCTWHADVWMMMVRSCRRGAPRLHRNLGKQRAAQPMASERSSCCKQRLHRQARSRAAHGIKALILLRTKVARDPGKKQGAAQLIAPKCVLLLLGTFLFR